jgi:LysR family hydrogen peroxide-inducible transcriptional activator
MNSLTLKQLRYVAAVAEAGHFGRAAEACHVSQPALSQQIQQVETICGAALFDRTARAVRPTPFGKEFLERARRVLEATETLDAFVSGRAGAPERPIRFGLIPTVAPYLLPEAYPALVTHLPDLRFAVSESKTETLIAGLVDGTIDLAVIATPPPNGPVPFETEILFEDGFVLATRSDETVSQPVDLGRIDSARMLLLDEGHCFRDQALAACRLSSEAGARTFAATSLSTIVEFVANGQGVTLLPAIALAKEAATGRIAVHALTDPGAGRTLSLIWRRGAPFADTFRQIAAILRTANAPDGAQTGVERTAAA